MLADIEFCKQLGYEGVVSGALSGDGIPDLERTSQLLEAAAPMQFVFHRAIDWVADPLSWIQPLTDIGVNTILSSGGAKTAADGLDLLKAMDRLNPACRIIPASGVGAQNAQLFLGAGFSWIHLSGSRPSNPLNAPARLSMYSARMLRDEVVYRTDADAIRALRQALNKM